MIFGNKEQILYGNRFNGTKGNGYQPIKKEQTNEEWFCQLPTEEKAKVFHKIFMARTFCHICPEGGVCDIGYKCKYHEGEVDDFVMWLKQPHTTIKE